MKKILIIIILISSFLFSQCCTEYGFEDGANAPISSIDLDTGKIYGSHNCVGWTPPPSQELKSECTAKGELTEITTTNNYSFNVAGGDLNGYYSDGEGHYCTAWATNTQGAILKYDCVCNEESDPPPPAVPPAPNGYYFDLVYSKDCKGNEVGDSAEFIDENNISLKFSTSQYMACCGTAIAYYLVKPSTCEDGQEKDGNGDCRDTCGTDGLMVDGDCLERASCKEFYRDMTAISVGDTPSCDNPYNADENRAMYMDIYNLFPNQEVTEDSILTCCYRDWAKDTDGDGIDDSIDADIDGDGENELEDTDGDGVADVYEDEKNNDNYNPTDGSTTNTDSNTTNTDSNTTNMDSNTTDSTVTNEILKDIQGDLQKGTSDIVNAITEQTTQSHTDSTAIKSSIDSMAEQSHTDSTAIKSSIDSMAEQSHTDSTAIKSSIDSMAEQSHTDSTAIKSSIDSMAEQSHTDLEGIKEGTDVLKDLREEGETAKQEKEGMSESLNNALSGMSGTYDGLVGKIGELASIGGNAPHFVGSGDSKFQGEVYGKTIVFDFKMVANLRQYIDIIWILLLAYFNFRIYLWIIKFIIKIGV